MVSTANFDGGVRRPELLTIQDVIEGEEANMEAILNEFPNGYIIVELEIFQVIAGDEEEIPPFEEEDIIVPPTPPQLE